MKLGSADCCLQRPCLTTFDVRTQCLITSTSGRCCSKAHRHLRVLFKHDGQLLKLLYEGSCAHAQFASDTLRLVRSMLNREDRRRASTAQHGAGIIVLNGKSLEHSRDSPVPRMEACQGSMNAMRPTQTLRVFWSKGISSGNMANSSRSWLSGREKW